MRYVLKLVVLGLICLTGMGMRTNGSLISGLVETKTVDVKEVDETTREIPVFAENRGVADAYTPSVVCAIDIVSPEFEQQDNNRVKLTYSIRAGENDLRGLLLKSGAESNLIPGGELYDWEEKVGLEETFEEGANIRLASPSDSTRDPIKATGSSEDFDLVQELIPPAEGEAITKRVKKTDEMHDGAKKRLVGRRVEAVSGTTANTKSSQELRANVEIMGFDELSVEDQSLVENQSARLNKLLAGYRIDSMGKEQIAAVMRPLREVDEEVVELCQQLGGQLHVSFHSIRGPEVGLSTEMEDILGQLDSAKQRVDITKENTKVIDGVGGEAEIEQILAEIEASTSDYDKEKRRKSLGKLASVPAVSGEASGAFFRSSQQPWRGLMANPEIYITDDPRSANSTSDHTLPVTVERYELNDGKVSLVLRGDVAMELFLPLPRSVRRDGKLIEREISKDSAAGQKILQRSKIRNGRIPGGTDKRPQISLIEIDDRLAPSVAGANRVHILTRESELVTEEKEIFNQLRVSGTQELMRLELTIENLRQLLRSSSNRSLDSEE
jgi:hypothetical protein